MEKLTAQDMEFVKEVAITGNQTRAVKKAYPNITTDGSARKKGSVLVTNSNIVKAIEEAKRTIAEQLPDDLLVKVHLEGLNAFSGTGDNVQPDYVTRHKYLDTAHKIKGNYAPERTINLDLQVDITNPKAKELATKYEEELKKNLNVIK